MGNGKSMKDHITASIKQTVADRGLLSVLALFLVGCVGLLIYLGLNIHASDLQVVVHYTNFGTTNFYRDKWYYLLGFALFIIVVALTHIVLTVKILQEKGRDLALAFAWLSIIIVFITTITLYQIVRVASLT